MENKLIHVAVVPARKGSVGFKGKNRILCDETFNFINDVQMFDEIVVTTDDSVVAQRAAYNEYDVINRSAHLCQGDISIRDVIKDVIIQKNYGDNHIIWLLYLTIPYKNHNDFFSVKSKFDSKYLVSTCAFVNASTHPYDTWYLDENDELNKFIPNDVYRRQDKQDALEHHHYICAFKANMLDVLNSELICSNTEPIIINNNQREFLIEIDSKEEYENWKIIKNNIFKGK
jgi:CMP-N-acetylneuraminic acid synthetase